MHLFFLIFVFTFASVINVNMYIHVHSSEVRVCLIYLLSYNQAAKFANLFIYLFILSKKSQQFCLD